MYIPQKQRGTLNFLECSTRVAAGGGAMVEEKKNLFILIKIIAKMFFISIIYRIFVRSSSDM